MNNTGIGNRAYAISNYEIWQQIPAVNLWGVINGFKVFTNTMIAQNTQSVINTGSKQGITLSPGNTAYNVSKAGVKVLTKGLQHTLRNTDLLMNNARIDNRADAISNYEIWQQILAVNLWGIINGCQVFTNTTIAQNIPCVIISGIFPPIHPDQVEVAAALISPPPPEKLAAALIRPSLKSGGCPDHPPISSDYH